MQPRSLGFGCGSVVPWGCDRRPALDQRLNDAGETQVRHPDWLVDQQVGALCAAQLPLLWQNWQAGLHINAFRTMSKAFRYSSAIKL
jgi:hypothetical protein